jgi:hypothetical protein
MSIARILDSGRKRRSADLTAMVQALFFLGGDLGGCIIVTIELRNPHQCSVVQRAGSLLTTGREDSLLRERPHELRIYIRIVFSSSFRASESPVWRTTPHNPGNSDDKGSETQIGSAFFRAVLNFGEAQSKGSCQVLRFYKANEIAEFVSIQIRHGPKLERVLLPREDVISLNRLLPNRGNAIVDRGPDVEIDRMQRPMIHQDSDRAVL